jgi:hypothetical protein
MPAPTSLELLHTVADARSASTAIVDPATGAPRTLARRRAMCSIPFRSEMTSAGCASPMDAATCGTANALVATTMRAPLGMSLRASGREVQSPKS